MLCWKELIEQKYTSEKTSSNDDMRLLQIYLCRLYRTPGHEKALNMLSIEEVAAFLGLKVSTSTKIRQYDNHFLALVRQREHDLVNGLKGTPNLSFGPLVSSIRNLLKLNRIETKLLIYVLLLVKQPKAKEALRELEILEFGRAASALARALREPTQGVVDALEAGSQLILARLIEVPNRGSDIWDIVEPGPLLERLLIAATSSNESETLNANVEQSLFLNLCPIGPPPEFTVADFQGVTELQLLLDYLTDALIQKKSGKNILLHGKPGTGKTQLSRALADKLHAPLYEVPTQSESHSAMTGCVRLDAANMAQIFLEDRHGAILLFDEMEDAFREQGQLAKGWLNRLLEKNQAPVIWISNDISSVDPAFLRRFDFILEISGNHAHGNVERFRGMLSQLPVTRPWAESLASQPWMTPALASNLQEVARFMHRRQVVRNEVRLGSLLSHRIGVTEGSGQRPIMGATFKSGPIHRFPSFREEWLNTTPSLRQVARVVRQNGHARVCLYGPPGSGKTAYAEALAKRLGRPFKLVSGSSLLNMYVGETEKLIAQAFVDAERAGAVLLIDEADTFLYDRQFARNSWEISSVNEFMVRMERFNGILIATTNRFESLDKAILRRFRLKVRFDCLSEAHVCMILREVVRAPHQLDELPPAALSRFNQLTPGLIENALEQLALRGIRPYLHHLLPALDREQTEQFGGQPSKPMGFVQYSIGERP